MLQVVAAFSGFSVDDLAKAKAFYTETLELELADEKMGLRLRLPAGGELYVYDKGAAHQPATFTVLNFVVDDVEAAVEKLKQRGVTFEHYDDGPLKTDDKGIARGRASGMGPDIAWFKDPAGNILSVLQPDFNA